MVPSGFGDVVVSGMGLAMGSGRAGGKLTAADAAFAQVMGMVTQADGSQVAQC